MFIENESAGEPMPGSNRRGGASEGPLTRTKVAPNEVSTTRSVEGRGQALTRSA